MTNNQEQEERHPHTVGNQLLQDDEAKFFLASIINTLQDSIVTINLDGVITSWNRSAELLYGYSAAEAIGQPLHMVMFPPDFEPLRKSIEDIRNGLTVPVYQALRLHKSGQNLYLDVTLSPVLDAKGKVIGVSTVARDASESKLRAIIEAAIDFSIVTVDNEGVIIDWSSGAERMFGHSSQEAIGKHFEIIFSPEDRHGGIPMVEIETARDTGKSLDERWHMRKDGSRFFMSGIMTPLRKGPVDGFVKIARNITNRKLVEEALLISEERNSLAVDSAQMGEWEWDLSADIIHLSEAARAFLGLPGNCSEISRNVLLSCIYPPDEAGVVARLNTAISELKIFQAEYRIIRIDNKEHRWLNTYGRIIAHGPLGPSRMIGVLYDITQRKLLEKQKDDFISLASHELKTPVTAIKAFSEFLEQDFALSNATGSLSLLKKLNGQVDRLIQLIQNLLDSSKLTEGKMHLHTEAFDLNQAIGEQIEALQRIAGSRYIKWEPGNIPLLHADRNRILQVIINFVSNAIKYSPENSEINLSTEDKLDSVMLKVQDYGPGIPAEVQPFLFDRYYRVPGELLKSSGFGLGLYISAAIIRQHMGTIGVESAAGKGSTFYFTLPYS